VSARTDQPRVWAEHLRLDDVYVGLKGFYLLLGLLLIVLFIFSRRRFEQTVLVIGLSIVIILVTRLFSLQTTDLSVLLPEFLFLLAIGAVYGVVWLGTRRARKVK
jgi:hypothetical protein